MPSGDDDDDVVDASEDHPLTLRDDDVAGAAAGDARGRDVRGSMRSDDASSSRRRRRRRGLLRRLPRVNAWTVLAAAVVVQACAGLTYSFAVYSDALRVVFPRQRDVDLLGSFKDFGAYFGVAGGVLYDAYGPSVTLVVGALLHALGYVGVYATVTRRWPGFRARPPLWRTAGIIAVASNGNSLFDTAALCASMANFPTRKGLVSGVLKAYLGLSSAIFGQLYDAFIVPERENAPRRSAAFVLMIACVGGAVGVAMSPLVRIVPTPRRRKRAAAAAAAAAATAMFRRVILALVALVAWVTLAATVNDPDLIGASIPAWVNVALTTGMLAVLLSPWALLRGVIFGAGCGGGCGRAGGKRARQEEDDELRAGLLPGGDERTSDEEEEEEEDDDDEEEEEEEDEENPAPPALLRSPPLLRGQTSSSLTLAQSARSVEFWILFATLTLSSGAATTLVNNQDVVAAACGASDAASSAALVSLFSVCNCVGRLVEGLCSDAGARAGAPRAATLMAAQSLVAVGTAFVCASPTPGGVFAAVAINGFALGAHWSFLPSACAEIFGPTHLGAVYGGLSLSPMIGSYVLSTVVFGRAYDAAEARGGGGEGGECRGAGCFRAAMMTCVACCVASLALTWRLCARTARVCEHAREEGRRAASRVV